ncbi:MAG TPA: DUF302 domain-containing protein [Sulfurimonas sp.]|uniref:DUF302 domain-containing protein n=1 Tax=Sulfurimonas sp. TaxID=2022749 RepID=UPI002BDD3461|nr:DUF302 domain-containing protein [Sulfurimonas sp.]HUH42714.1 DUF302 domain-containing protein [Sulfurimonas sp.]
MSKKLFLILICLVSLNANDINIIQSKYSVSETTQKIKEIVISKGFEVFTIIDHKQNAKNVNMEMAEAKVILFGNPKAGTKLMQEDILSALDLPLRVLIFKDSTANVKVAFRDVSALKVDFKLSNKEELEAMDKGLSAIIAKATN